MEWYIDWFNHKRQIETFTIANFGLGKMSLDIDSINVNIKENVIQLNLNETNDEIKIYDNIES